MSGNTRHPCGGG